MKSINLLSPENSPEDKNLENNNEIVSSEKSPKHKTSSVFGVILLLFVAFLFARILYQHNLPEKEKTPADTNIPSILPKKHKEVKPKKQSQTTKQAIVEPQTIKVTPKPSESVEKVKPKPKLVSSLPIIPVEERKYNLLVDIFSSSKKATEQVKKIKSLGFVAHQQSIRVKQGVYMVYGGSETNYKSAKKLQKKLQKKGFETYLPSTKKKNYRVRTGVFNNRNYAQELFRKLKTKGFKAQLETTQMSLLKHEVRLGDFKTYQAAKAQQNALRAKGIKTTLLLRLDKK